MKHGVIQDNYPRILILSLSFRWVSQVFVFVEVASNDGLALLFLMNFPLPPPAPPCSGLALISQSRETVTCHVTSKDDDVTATELVSGTEYITAPHSACHIWQLSITLDRSLTFHSNYRTNHLESLIFSNFPLLGR